MRESFRYWHRSRRAALNTANGPKAGVFVGRLLRGEQGMVAVIVAFSAAVLMGFTALGVETGLWYAIKRQQQSAADAAALAGAYELAAGQLDGQSSVYANICAKAQGSASANGFSFDNSFTCPTSTPSPACTSASSGEMCLNQLAAGTGNNGSIEVYLAQQQNALLANFAKLSNVVIATHAVAAVKTAGDACILALAKSGTDITIQGSATVDLSNCGLAADSSSSSSISFGGGHNDILDASWFQTVGNYSTSGGPQIHVTTRLTDAAAITDPYSCNPPTIGCAGKITYSWPASPVNTSTPCYQDGSTPTTLQPGLYGKSSGSHKCSDGSGSSSPPMSFTSGTTTLCPGVYYLDGEDGHGSAFNVQGGTVQMGTAGSGGCPSNGINGVTIIAGSQSGTNGGGFNFKNGSVSLSAPTTRIPSGCTLGSTPCIPSGVLFYQDPTDADTSSHGNGLTADSTSTGNMTLSLTGVLYTPATNVTFTGNASSTCFMIVALTVTFTGNSTMAGGQSACSSAGVTGPIALNVTLTQ